MTTMPIEAIEITEVAQAVTLTPTAASKLSQILQEKNLPDHGLRVFVAGGGCSGLQYGMAFEGQPRDMDTIVEAARPEGLRRSGQPGISLRRDDRLRRWLDGRGLPHRESQRGGGLRLRLVVPHQEQRRSASRRRLRLRQLDFPDLAGGQVLRGLCLSLHSAKAHRLRTAVIIAA